MRAEIETLSRALQWADRVDFYLKWSGVVLVVAVLVGIALGHGTVAGKIVSSAVSAVLMEWVVLLLRMGVVALSMPTRRQYERLREAETQNWLPPYGEG